MLVHAQIDLAALADYMLFTVDCSEEFEEDQFSIEFMGDRFFVERRRSHFRIENGAGEVFDLPRH